MKEILLTERQISRAERNKAIIASFKELRKKNPDVSPQRIFATIAEGYDLGAAAIRQICKRSGVYANGKNNC